MKVFASTLAAFAIGQESSDKWTGFDYDYGFGDDLQKNQASQSSVGNTLYGQDIITDRPGDLAAAVGGIQPIFNYHGDAITDNMIVTGSTPDNAPGIAFARMELGNGRMCWFCDSDSKGIKNTFGDICDMCPDTASRSPTYKTYYWTHDLNPLKCLQLF